MFLSSIAAVAEAAEEHGNPKLHTWPAGLIAAIVFFALAMVTLSYKNVANRHHDKAERYAAEHGTDEHGAGH